MTSQGYHTPPTGPNQGVSLNDSPSRSAHSLKSISSHMRGISRLLFNSTSCLELLGNFYRLGSVYDRHQKPEPALLHDGFASSRMPHKGCDAVAGTPWGEPKMPTSCCHSKDAYIDHFWILWFHHHECGPTGMASEV